ncbi:cytochrome C oxidase subunit IV family protein [Ramlibacter humi]|uniref:Caa(3)-type oxidase subunit IV n=1 Tax=Ramlibacter humi TaxID=2530451 RepID=A0A4Z0BFZ0_9BURK|nr:cytochrome C oxidase subunit IV family protein [Ramlibacter humi]TFY97207.1 Caa(3)-type oxidase subunit IV [Ramlibacter humi]
MKNLRRHSLKLAAAWVALLALMLTSLGSAYLPLGRGNLVAGLAIATTKSLIVLWLFMDLRRAPPTLRLTAALGFAALALLFTLSGVDFATRDMHPAAMQQPQQLAPTGKKGSS